MRVVFLFMLVTIVGTTGCARDDAKEQAKADPLKGIKFDKAPEPAPQPAPKPAEPDIGVKGNAQPKGLVQGVRAAAYRPQRLNELKQIGIFFTQLVDETGGKNPRTEDEFINYIKRDSNTIAEAIKDKYYILNLKVNMRDGNAVIAYESLQDQGGYQSVRVAGSVAPIPIDELKKLVLQP